MKKPEINTILQMEYAQLNTLIHEYGYDRLGSAQGKFYMALHPIEPGEVEYHYDYDMFIEVSVDVVREFFIRKLHHEIIDDSYMYDY